MVVMRRGEDEKQCECKDEKTRAKWLMNSGL
jgi:hypothetical protein